jgi:hypothetical protein
VAPPRRVVALASHVDTPRLNRPSCPTDTVTTVTDRTEIFKRYGRSWFLIDFFSTVPFGRIQNLISMGGITCSEDTGKQSGDLTMTRLLRILKLVRLLKLARIFKLTKVRASSVLGAQREASV